MESLFESIYLFVLLYEDFTEVEILFYIDLETSYFLEIDFAIYGLKVFY
jgi:hypothetical protein